MGFCMHIAGVICDNCRNTTMPYYQPPPYVIPYMPQPIVTEGLKCDLCGSTAIDHTEKQCMKNRQLNPFSPENKTED